MSNSPCTSSSTSLSLSRFLYTHTGSCIYFFSVQNPSPLSLSSCAHLMCRVRREPARELVVEWAHTHLLSEEEEEAARENVLKSIHYIIRRFREERRRRRRQWKEKKYNATQCVLVPLCCCCCCSPLLSLLLRRFLFSPFHHMYI